MHRAEIRVPADAWLFLDQPFVLSIRSISSPVFAAVAWRVISCNQAVLLNCSVFFFLEHVHKWRSLQRCDLGLKFLLCHKSDIFNIL